MTQPLNCLLVGKDRANETAVFSGGACNAIAASGASERNTSRDGVNQWLNDQGILFFDPQIHPATHGRDYDYDQDGPGEQLARASAKVTLYQIGDETVASVTAMEALADGQSGKDVVLWISSALDEKGKPTFQPAGDPSSEDPCVSAHLKAYQKSGVAIRKNLLAFVANMTNVSVVFTEDEAKEKIEAVLQKS